MEIFNIKNLSFKYKGSDKKALEEICLDINEGDFVLLCGSSGSGKTTLLRLLKNEIAPFGDLYGEILYKGTPLNDLPEKKSAKEIGFCFQNPDTQIVTDKVWHELAFGLENMAVPNHIIRRRVGESASFFGINSWFNQDTDTLSGGQKQLLNLAGIMTMNPRVLILDEPSAQLDPIAAAELFSTLYKLNQELGITIIMAEHRLEEVFPFADKVVLMEDGHILSCTSPCKVGNITDVDKSSVYPGLPSSIRMYKEIGGTGDCPVAVKDGRRFLEDIVKSHNSIQKEYDESREKYSCAKKSDGCHSSGKDIQPAVSIRNAYFRYEKNSADVLKEMNFSLRQGELYCLLGGNGSGKTTVLKVISGLKKVYNGSVSLFGKEIGKYKRNILYGDIVSFLPQNPQTVFLKDTVEEDLLAVKEYGGVEKDSFKRIFEGTVDDFEIAHLLSRNPLDLSGGELQKCAMAKLLLKKPKLLLLDEPTKGLDPAAKIQLAGILKGLKSEGITILLVTHDVEFAAEYADRCGLFFDGNVISESPAKEFFAENMFYTTAASRISRGIYQGTVTIEDVVLETKRILKND